MKAPRGQVVFALGFFVIVAQTLLFRDFLTVFEGNELSIGGFLASWLLWVAIGAMIARRWQPAACFDWLALAYLPAFVLQHYLTVRARTIAGVASYELFPYTALFVLTLLTNAPVSFVTGFLFTAACRWRGGHSPGPSGAGSEGLPVARVYVLETLGAFSGGIMVTLLLARGITMAATAAWAALVLAGAALSVRPASPMRVGLVVLLLAGLASGAAGRWAGFDNQLEWRQLLPEDGYEGTFTTAQAKYLYGHNEGQFVVMAWGGVCEAPGNRIHASEVIAATLAQRPAAREIMVVGPDSLSICRELFELGQVRRVTWLHPDPKYPQALVRTLRRDGWTPPPDLEIPAIDMRSFLRKCTSVYDLVILNLPEPASLVLNRYYTVEFFGLLKRVLGGKGAVALRVSGGENYLGEELGYLGSSALSTLQSVFNEVAIKPGEESWFIASDAGGLTEAPAVLRDRFAAIPGATSIYPPEGLLSLYLPDRIAFQREQYRRLLDADTGHVLVSTDRQPKALLFGLLLALRRAGMARLTLSLPTLFSEGLWVAIAAVALYGLLRFIFLLRSPPRVGGTNLFDGYFLVFSTGLAAMSLNIVLMFLFQSQSGSLFLNVGLITAVFMLGAFGGSHALERILPRLGKEPGYLLPAMLAVHGGLFVAVLLLPMQVSLWGYALLFSLCGVFTGVYFPLVARRSQAAGCSAALAGSRLESLDHLGGAVGAGLTGLVLLPVLGMPRTVVFLALVILVNAVALAAARDTLPPTDAFDRRARPTGYVLFGVGAFLLIASRLVANAASAQEGQTLLDAVHAMAGEAELHGQSLRMDDGTAMSYYAVTAGGVDRGYAFSTKSLVRDIAGYGGPITLAIYVGPDGMLRDYQILRSHETPAYLRMLEPWKARLLDQRDIDAAALARVDAVSGATMSCEAIRRTLKTAMSRFAHECLGLRSAHGSEPIRGAPWMDPRFLMLAVFSAAAVAARYRPGRWVRRAVLAASVLILGFGLNLQYASHHAFMLLGLDVPGLHLTGGGFMVAAVPVVVLLFGNIYCGYVCPFGALQELVGELRPRGMATDPRGTVWRYARLVKYGLLFLLVILFALTRDTAVLSADPLTTIFCPFRSRTTLTMATAILVLSVVYRRFWCRNLCPAGAFLALLSGVRLLRRWLPSTRPRQCDLGLLSRKELDCLYCDRCRHEAK